MAQADSVAADDIARFIEEERNLQQKYNPSRPFVQNVAYADGSTQVYLPLQRLSAGSFSASFALPDGIQPTAESLSELFLPDELVDSIVAATNKYAGGRLPAHNIEPVDRKDILKFVAIIYYMGLVKLPAKTDYWRSESILCPALPIASLMSFQRFVYIWRNIRLCPIELDLTSDEEELLSDEEEADEFFSPATKQEEPDGSRRHAKVGLLINHCNTVAKMVCRHPSFLCSAEEILSDSVGCWPPSSGTQCNPSKHRHMLGATRCLQTAFIYHVELFSTGTGVGGIGAISHQLLKALPRRKQLRYVVWLSDIFITLDAITKSREMNIGVVGRLLAFGGWLPQEILAIQDKRFNTFYRQPGRHNYIVCRWSGHSTVSMISTVHTGEERAMSLIRRPTSTSMSPEEIESVWGRQSSRNIIIPGMINEYNRWTSAVRKGNEMIALYRANVFRPTTWHHIMMQCLDVLRVNAYVVCKEASTSEKLEQNCFIQEWIKSILGRANAAPEPVSDRNTPFVPVNATKTTKRVKRQRFSKHNPTLSPRRLVGDSTVHTEIIKRGDQRACVYCSYLHALQKNHPAEQPQKVRRITRMCSKCNVYVCQEHFAVYHGWATGRAGVEGRASV